MARGLTEFASVIRDRGVAKSSKYEVDLTVPSFMQGTDYANDVDIVSMLAESATLPEFGLVTSRVVDDGIGREFVFDKTYAPIVMTFICDSTMDVKRFFDAWSQGIIKSKSGTFRYYSDYVTNIEIYQLNEIGDVTYGVTLIDAYAKVVSDIPLSSSSGDYNRCIVQFIYRDWFAHAKETTNLNYDASGYDSTTSFEDSMKDITSSPDWQEATGS